jgi:hypothetical protein
MVNFSVPFGEAMTVNRGVLGKHVDGELDGLLDPLLLLPLDPLLVLCVVGLLVLPLKRIRCFQHYMRWPTFVRGYDNLRRKGKN